MPVLHMVLMFGGMVWILTLHSKSVIYVAINMQGTIADFCVHSVSEDDGANIEGDGIRSSASRPNGLQRAAKSPQRRSTCWFVEMTPQLTF